MECCSSSDSEDDFIASTQPSRRVLSAARRKKTPPSRSKSTNKKPKLSRPSSAGLAAAAAGATAVPSSDRPQQQKRSSTSPPASCTAAAAAAATPSLPQPPESAAPWSQPADWQQEDELEQPSDRCPVCNTELGRISDTDAGRAAHVNACLDAAAVTQGAPQHAAPPAPPPAPPAVDLTELCTQEEEVLQDDTAWRDEEEEQEDTPDSLMHNWLVGVDAAEVAGIFQAADIDLSVLPHLNDNDLQELGIADNELRSRILHAATAGAGAAEPAEPAPNLAAASTQQQQPQPQQLHSSDLWGGDTLLHSQDCGEEQWGDCAVDDDDGGGMMLPEQPADFDGDQPSLQQQQQQREGPWGQQQHHEWQHDGERFQQHQQECQQQQDDVDDEWQQDGATHGDGFEQAGPQQQPQQPTWQQQQQQQPIWQQQPHGWQPGFQQQQQQPQTWQQQQQQQPGGPLQPVNINQQQQARTVSNNSNSNTPRGLQGAAASPGNPLQSSITGFVVVQQPAGRQQQQQQQQGEDPKEQWRMLFKRPKQPLGAHNPAQQRPAPKQARLGAHGQVVPAAAEPQPPPSAAAAAEAQAAAAAAPVPPVPQNAPGLPSWWPAWRRLPGTNIIVDCFGRSAVAAGPNRTWVLTHFHADHYMGLSRGFRQGVVVCTPITAALVRLKLKVPPERLRVLQLGQEVVIEGTRLQLIDANHCPGAAMVVAHPPGNALPVLHTGDARLTPEATRSQPALQALVGRAVLVLDTTYADPTYCFPPQQDVLDWVLKAVKAELFNPRCLFLFGTYTIGKERLFLHVASALRRKVYVAAAKRSIMSCLDLPPHLADLLTTNHLDASIHAVPMGQVTLESMESLLLRYKGRYTAVVGFKPTGWSHPGGSGRGGQGGGSSSGTTSSSAAAAAAGGLSRSSLSIKPNRRRSQRGTVVLYQVPYSEHSSCAELRSFVEWLKPVRIIPSVNNDSGNKLRAMLAAVTAKDVPTTGPMDAFAQRPPRQRQQQQQHQSRGPAS